MTDEIYVDRSGEDDPDEPQIIVGFPDGEKIRFWLMGLPDKEYIARAEAIKNNVSFVKLVKGQE